MLRSRRRSCGVTIRFGVFPASSLLENGVDRGAVDALHAKLLADRPLPARSCPVARLYPGPGECLVVEDPELQQPVDGTVHEVRPVARAAEPASDLGHRALARLEEARRGIEDDLRIVDRCSPLAPLRHGLAAAGRAHQNGFADHQHEDDEHAASS